MEDKLNWNILNRLTFNISSLRWGLVFKSSMDLEAICNFLSNCNFSLDTARSEASSLAAWSHFRLLVLGVVVAPALDCLLRFCALLSSTSFFRRLKISWSFSSNWRINFPSFSRNLDVIVLLTRCSLLRPIWVAVLAGKEPLWDDDDIFRQNDSHKSQQLKNTPE